MLWCHDRDNRSLRQVTTTETTLVSLDLTAYATLEVSGEDNLVAVRELIALAAQQGYALKGGSERDLARQEVAEYEREWK